MDIVKIDINLLNPAPYNPRLDLKPTDPEYIKLKNSIQEFGYVEPIVINKRNNVIIGGHQRYKVLKDLGYKDVDVVYVDLDDIHEKSLNIALNKISGDWDADKLEDLLREINLDDSIDTLLTGFDLNEIETMFGSADDIEDEDSPDLDELSKEMNQPSDNERQVKMGDMFKLGRHKLLCGDSYKEETYNNLVGSDKVDLLFTDPPYLYLAKKSADQAFAGTNFCDNTKKIVIETSCELGDMDASNIEYLFKKEIPSMYFCCNNKLIKDYLILADKYKYKNDVHVWCKQGIPLHGGVTTGRYIMDLEYIIYCRGSNAIFNNKLDGSYYRHYNKDNTLDIQEDVIRRQWYSHYAYISNNEVIKDREDAGSTHPTVKPLKLIIPKIAISSNEDSIVVDMFGGSGSTMIACEKLNRSCYMVEYNPKYINEIINRWEVYTGKKAEYIGNLLSTDKIDEGDK